MSISVEPAVTLSNAVLIAESVIRLRFFKISSSSGVLIIRSLLKICSAASHLAFGKCLRNIAMSPAGI